MILLDTHAWVWYCSRKQSLTAAAKEAIDKSDRVFVSSISCWEVAMLESKKRLTLSVPVWNWVEKSLSLPKIELITLDAWIAVNSMSLPSQFHGDPSDRIIVATALQLGCPIVTKDRLIQDCSFVETIW